MYAHTIKTGASDDDAKPSSGGQQGSDSKTTPDPKNPTSNVKGGKDGEKKTDEK